MVIGYPLYVDALPSNLVGWLERAELAPGTLVYALSNLGFYESSQIAPSFGVLENYCADRGLEWRGGLMVGAGGMIVPTSDRPATSVFRRHLAPGVARLADAVAAREDARAMACEPRDPAPGLSAHGPEALEVPGRAQRGGHRRAARGRPSLADLVRRDPVLVASLALAALSCVAVPPDAEYLSYVDLRTIGMLFSLMTVTAGLSRVGVFDAACERLLAVAHGPRRLCLALTLLSFFSSMLITNDVALVTFVPLALLALAPFRSDRLTCFTAVMMTVAANLGSMLTPVGNPQNLYLYSASHMGLASFLLLMLPYAPGALVLLAVAVVVFGRVPDARSRGAALAVREEPASVPLARTVPWLLLFALVLLSVARVLPFQACVVAAVAVALVVDRGALAHVDYALLVTFVAFFVFVGNMGRVSAVDSLIADVVRGHELAVAVGASQMLSNVPAAILLSGFTTNWPALIVGTNLGGLGTLIASMASLISYEQLARELPGSKGRYFAMFTVCNVVFLAALLCLYLLIG